MDETRRTRAACGATDPRGADEGDTRRESGCGLPRSTDHVHNGPRNAGSCDKTAKRGRYRHRTPGQYTEWNAMHTHAHAQAVGGCKISPPVAIPLAPGRKTTGTAEFLHGSLWKESQFCRLPKQQRGSPQGRDSENDGKAVRQLSRTQYKYKLLRHIHHDTNTSNTSKHNDGNTTRRSRPREPSENEKGGPKKNRFTYQAKFKMKIISLQPQSKNKLRSSTG